MLRGVICPVCGSATEIAGFTDNLRESGYCPTCGSWTRVRQLAVALLDAGSALVGTPVPSIRELAAVPGIRIYNTESRGCLHEQLSPAPGYVCSEYFGPEFTSGETHPSGTVHQDLEELSFDDGEFDLVISTDVLEHVPDPYRAHGEIRRVLRPGGHHVFTVPYREGVALDEVRARREPDGSIDHLLPAEYHGDPVRPEEGALVFTIFGLEMVPNVARIGFDVRVLQLWDPTRGIVGGGGFVFDAARS